MVKPKENTKWEKLPLAFENEYEEDEGEEVEVKISDLMKQTGIKES